MHVAQPSATTQTFGGVKSVRAGSHTRHRPSTPDDYSAVISSKRTVTLALTANCPPDTGTPPASIIIGMG